MTAQFHQTMNGMIDAIHNKDLDSIMELFADDAVLYDPHYPIPRMEGKPAISCGLKWAFNGMKQFGFSINHAFVSADGNSGAVEMNTSHVLRTGQKLDFPQVFIVELKEGKISRLQAYEPYGPGGVNGIVLNIIRFFKKLFPSKAEWQDGALAGYKA